MKKKRPYSSEQFCTYDNELERALRVKSEILSAYKRTNQHLKNKIEDLEGKLADLKDHQGIEETRSAESVKKIEWYIEKAREDYYHAMKNKLEDDEIAYRQGRWRGLFDAYTSLKVRDEK